MSLLNKEYWVNFNKKGTPKHCKVGTVTWTFGNFVEFWIDEIKDWKIVSLDKVEEIKSTSNKEVPTEECKLTGSMPNL